MSYPLGFDPTYENHMIRRLEWFEKKGEGYIVGEEELVNLDIFKLREIFGVENSFYKDPDEPYDEAYDPYMTYGYDVTEELAKILQPHVKHQINLKKYNYYVDAYARPK